MKRVAGALLVVSLALPGAEVRAFAPALPDGGVDAGQVGGAGRPAVARWRAITGPTLFDGGYTDLVELSVDASVELRFPRPVIMTVCDDPIVEMEPSRATVRLLGTEPGVTQCGFWFDESPVPNRFVGVSVLP